MAATAIQTPDGGLRCARWNSAREISEATQIGRTRKSQSPVATDRAPAKNPSSKNGYTLNEEPQPQVLFTFGLSNLKPAPSRVST